MASQKAVMPPEAAEKPDRAGAPKTEETPLEAFASLCVIAVLGLYLFTFLAQHFVIPSGSMEKTLLIGDHLVVDRITLAPPASWMPLVRYREVRHGDIIVFFKPGEPDLYLVKRVIGIPGDRIHLRGGIVYRNGVKLEEPQAARPTPDNYQPYRDDFPSIAPSDAVGATAQWSNELASHVVAGELVVPPGRYFAMGDNRTNSLDSRFWGFVPRANILGRPLINYWSFNMPPDQIDKTSLSDNISYMVYVVTHFLTETRWSRTLHRVG